MKKLDRYILGEFTAPLMLVVLGFAALVQLVDVVDTLPRMREWGAPLGLILAYHLLRFPYIATQVMPIGVMLATLISLGGLARSSELAAARAGGVSSLRIAAPILGAAMLLSLLLLLVSETLVPKATYSARYIQKVLIEKRDMAFDVQWRYHMAKSLGGRRQLYAAEFDASAGIMRGVIIISRGPDQGISGRIDATSLSYGEGGAWQLKDGVERVFNAEGDETSMRRFRLWPIELPEHPKDFMVDSDKKEQDLLQLSYRELSDIIQVLKQTGADFRKEAVCRQVRLSYPLSCFILALLGCSLPFLFPSGARAMTGAAIGILVSLASGMSYLVFIQIGLSLGKSGALPVLLAAWIGNLIFIAIGSFTLWKVNR